MADILGTKMCEVCGKNVFRCTCVEEFFCRDCGFAHEDGACVDAYTMPRSYVCTICSHRFSILDIGPRSYKRGLDSDDEYCCDDCLDKWVPYE